MIDRDLLEQSVTLLSELNKLFDDGDKSTNPVSQVLDTLRIDERSIISLIDHVVKEHERQWPEQPDSVMRRGLALSCVEMGIICGRLEQAAQEIEQS